MTKEICICAAIKTPTGFIIRGHRHCDAIRTASEIKALTKIEIQRAEQGFVTSENRFVDRKEGCLLQIEAGIESVDKSHPYFHGELYSEDLY